MLRRVFKNNAISFISNASLWTVLLLLCFVVSTSPISLYLVEESNFKDLSLVTNRVLQNAKLTKYSSSPSSISSYLNDPEKPSSNELVKNVLNSGRKLLSAQTSLSLVSSNVEFPNTTNSKMQHIYSSKSEVKISSRSPKEFFNVDTMNNISDLHSEHDVSTINVKPGDNISDNIPSSAFENSFSFSNTLNASYQSSSFSASPLLENNSSTIPVSPAVLEINFNSSNSTITNDFTSLPKDRETTVDSTSTGSQGKGMTPGAVAGVVIAVLAAGIIITGTVIYVFYQRCGRSKKLESKCPSDNCGYVDDTLRSSGYLNSHIELPKESSEEMTSLDNDSFLNSLESMTFQNYWADNTKNTKV